MVRKYKSVKVGVMVDKAHIGPILLRENVTQLRLVVPFGSMILRPLDRRTMRLKPGMADIFLGRTGILVRTLQTVLDATRIFLVGEERLENPAQRISLCPPNLVPSTRCAQFVRCVLELSQR